jgi:hypothetical protein
MPRIDAPDVRKGFWLTVGVIVALMLFSLAQLLLRGVRRPKTA